MRQLVEVQGAHPDLPPQQAFSVLGNFESHVRLSEVVRSVHVERLEGGERRSHWEVAFRNGILRWSQRDDFDERRMLVRYSLLSGDPAELEGHWRVTPHGQGCRVHFQSEFDLGIGSFGELLDPLAARILRETVVAQMSQIFGPRFAVETPGPPLPRAAPALR